MALGGPIVIACWTMCPLPMEASEAESGRGRRPNPGLAERCCGRTTKPWPNQALFASTKAGLYSPVCRDQSPRAVRPLELAGRSRSGGSAFR